MVKEGTYWTNNRLEFVVTKVVNDDSHTWIHYKNIKTKQEYSCYEEAFKQRFNEVVNYRYAV